VAYTTRSPRNGEVDGVDYNFVSRDVFLAKAQKGDFLEYKEVHGNFYATPLSDLERMLEQGLVAILKIDVQGALSVIPLRPDALSIFILPPSSEELERRIRSRALDDTEAIEKRLQNARDEIEISYLYQYQVINKDVDEVVSQLEAWVG